MVYNKAMEARKAEQERDKLKEYCKASV